MATARPGDHPFTDMLEYKVSCFGPEVDGLARKIARHDAFESVKSEVSDIYWDYAPTWDGGALEGGTEKAKELLLAIYERLPK